MNEGKETAFTIVSIFKPSYWRKYPSTCLLSAVIISIYFLIAGKLVSSSLQQRSIAQYHLTHPSFIQWALYQSVPAMYNFANEIWIGDQPQKSTPRYPIDLPDMSHYMWLNHYPLRVVTFNWSRHRIFSGEDDKFISLRSTYQNTVMETGYVLMVGDGKVRMQRIY